MRIGNWGHGKPQAVPTVSSYTVARRSRHFLQEVSWEVFNHHQPYSPDLVTSGFLLYLYLKIMVPIEIHRQLCQVYGHTRLLLQEFAWEVFNNHPPYISDLVPSDFHLFLYFKKFQYCQRQNFQNDREVEMSITVVPIPGSRVLRHKIQKLVPRYDNYLNSEDEYVEK